MDSLNKWSKLISGVKSLGTESLGEVRGDSKKVTTRRSDNPQLRTLLLTGLGFPYSTDKDVVVPESDGETRLSQKKNNKCYLSLAGMDYLYSKIERGSFSANRLGRAIAVKDSQLYNWRVASASDLHFRRVIIPPEIDVGRKTQMEVLREIFKPSGATGKVAALAKQIKEDISDNFMADADSAVSEIMAKFQQRETTIRGHEEAPMEVIKNFSGLMRARGLICSIDTNLPPETVEDERVKGINFVFKTAKERRNPLREFVTMMNSIKWDESSLSNYSYKGTTPGEIVWNSLKQLPQPCGIQTYAGELYIEKSGSPKMQLKIGGLNYSLPMRDEEIIITVRNMGSARLIHKLGRPSSMIVYVEDVKSIHEIWIRAMVFIGHFEAKRRFKSKKELLRDALNGKVNIKPVGEIEKGEGFVAGSANSMIHDSGVKVREGAYTKALRNVIYTVTPALTLINPETDAEIDLGVPDVERPQWMGSLGDEKHGSMAEFCESVQALINGIGYRELIRQVASGGKSKDHILAGLKGYTATQPWDGSYAHRAIQSPEIDSRSKLILLAVCADHPDAPVAKTLRDIRFELNGHVFHIGKDRHDGFHYEKFDAINVKYKNDDAEGAIVRIHDKGRSMINTIPGTDRKRVRLGMHEDNRLETMKKLIEKTTMDQWGVKKRKRKIGEIFEVDKNVSSKVVVVDTVTGSTKRKRQLNSTTLKMHKVNDGTAPSTSTSYVEPIDEEDYDDEEADWADGLIIDESYDDYVENAQ